MKEVVIDELVRRIEKLENVIGVQEERYSVLEERHWELNARVRTLEKVNVKQLKDFVIESLLKEEDMEVFASIFDVLEIRGSIKPRDRGPGGGQGNT
jgi:secreted Zn-dependent insulinase-like peptidase